MTRLFWAIFGLAGVAVLWVVAALFVIDPVCRAHAIKACSLVAIMAVVLVFLEWRGRGKRKAE